MKACANLKRRANLKPSVLKLGALKKLRSESIFDLDEIVLLYLTGAAMKHFDALKVERDQIPVLSRDAQSL